MRKPLLTAVRTIAVFEAAKGAIVLLAGLGLLSLINRDVQAIAEEIVRFMRLNPASRYPHIFIDAAARVTNARLWAMAGAATLYAVVRCVEAYGLWFERRWAEWFALISCGMYIPLEIYHLVRAPSWTKGTLLTVNVAIVVYMAWLLLHPGAQERELAEAAKSEPKPPA